MYIQYNSFAMFHLLCSMRKCSFGFMDD